MPNDAWRAEVRLGAHRARAAALEVRANCRTRGIENWIARSKARATLRDTERVRRRLRELTPGGEGRIQPHCG